MGLYTETNGEEGERFVTVRKARAFGSQLVFIACADACASTEGAGGRRGAAERR